MSASPLNRYFTLRLFGDEAAARGLLRQARAALFQTRLLREQAGVPVFAKTHHLSETERVRVLLSGDVAVVEIHAGRSGTQPVFEERLPTFFCIPTDDTYGTAGFPTADDPPKDSTFTIARWKDIDGLVDSGNEDQLLRRLVLNTSYRLTRPLGEDLSQRLRNLHPGNQTWFAPLPDPEEEGAAWKRQRAHLVVSWWWGPRRHADMFQEFGHRPSIWSTDGRVEAMRCVWINGRRAVYIPDAYYVVSACIAERTFAPSTETKLVIRVVVVLGSEAEFFSGGVTTSNDMVSAMRVIDFAFNGEEISRSTPTFAFTASPGGFDRRTWRWIKQPFYFNASGDQAVGILASARDFSQGGYYEQGVGGPAYFLNFSDSGGVSVEELGSEHQHWTAITSGYPGAGPLLDTQFVIAADYYHGTELRVLSIWHTAGAENVDPHITSGSGPVTVDDVVSADFVSEDSLTWANTSELRLNGDTIASRSGNASSNNASTVTYEHSTTPGALFGNSSVKWDWETRDESFVHTESMSTTGGGFWDVVGGDLRGDFVMLHEVAGGRAMAINFENDASGELHVEYTDAGSSGGIFTFENSKTSGMTWAANNGVMWKLNLADGTLSTYGPTAVNPPGLGLYYATWNASFSCGSYSAPPFEPEGFGSTGTGTRTMTLFNGSTSTVDTPEWNSGWNNYVERQIGNIFTARLDPPGAASAITPDGRCIYFGLVTEDDLYLGVEAPLNTGTGALHHSKWFMGGVEVDPPPLAPRYPYPTPPDETTFVEYPRELDSNELTMLAEPLFVGPLPPTAATVLPINARMSP
jgi:hypothetical protein